MESPERYTEVWNARFAEFLARGFPDANARVMASEAAAAQILAESRSRLGLPPAVAAPAVRKLRMAKGDSLGLIIMGGLSVAIGASTFDWSTGVIGAFIGAFGVMELMGYRRFLARQPRAREYLVGSQLGVLFLILGYCVWKLYGPVSPGSNSTLDAMKELGADASEFGEMAAGIEHMVYFSVAVVSVLYQGGLALYYWRQTEE